MLPKRILDQDIFPFWNLITVSGHVINPENKVCHAYHATTPHHFPFYLAREFPNSSRSNSFIRSYSRFCFRRTHSWGTYLCRQYVSGVCIRYRRAIQHFSLFSSCASNLFRFGICDDYAPCCRSVFFHGNRTSRHKPGYGSAARKREPRIAA